MSSIHPGRRSVQSLRDVTVSFTAAIVGSGAIPYIQCRSMYLPPTTYFPIHE
jgi:hypothetical protein